MTVCMCVCVCLCICECIAFSHFGTMEFVEQIVDFFKASPSFKFDYSSNGTGAFIKVDVLSKLLHVLRGGDTAARMFFL